MHQRGDAFDRAVGAVHGGPAHLHRAAAAAEARIAAGGEIQTVEVGPDGVHPAVMPLKAEPGMPDDLPAPGTPAPAPAAEPAPAQ